MIRTSEARAILHQAKAIQAQERRERNKSKPPRVEKVGQAPRVKDNAHLARIRRLPCIATLVETGQELYGVDACHVRSNYPAPGWGGNPGLGSKPSDWRCLPLTRAFHTMQHGMKEMAFWSLLGIYPPAVCGELRDAPDFDAMLAVIRRVAAEARARR